MTAILTIIGALLPFLLTELQNLKVISPGLAALIEGIEGAGASFLTTASTNPTSAITILAAIQAALAVLQTETTVDPKTLATIAAFDSAITAGINAAKIDSVDPSKLHPIAPIA